MMQALLEVSKLRSRDQVLDLIIPKILGLLGCPRTAAPTGVKVTVNGSIELYLRQFADNGFALSVYAPTAKSLVDKVFSAHLVPFPPSGADPAFFCYQRGRCGVMSWKRGTWEDAIAESSNAPCEIAALGQHETQH